MTDKPPVRVVNSLIAGLPRDEREALRGRCESVHLDFGAVLSEPGRAYKHVHFPVTGIISLMTTVGGHPPLETGLIGNEGMLGATLLLGVAAAPLRSVVKGPGTALRMTAVQFRKEITASQALLRTLKSYLYVLMAQLSQTAACTRFHEVEPRLARGLLMTHDRAHADRFHLTHQVLADMLGVQRSAVTIAAGELQRRHLIRYIRGEIKVLDRKGLEAASCECYQAVVEDDATLSA